MVGGGGGKSINISIIPVPLSKEQTVKFISSPEAIKAYLDGAGDPKAKHEAGWPLLLGAVKAGRLEVVRSLLSAGADANGKHEKGGGTALHYLAWSKSIETSKQKQIGDLLLGASADVNARNDKGHTPLMLAAAQGSIEFVHFLLAKKAKPGESDKSGHSAEWFARKYKHTEVAELLKKATTE